MTKPIDPNYLASELRTAQREALRLERRVQDLEAELADKDEQLLLKDRRITVLERGQHRNQVQHRQKEVSPPQTHFKPRPVQKMGAKRTASIWTVPRLLEVWAYHFQRGMSATELADHYGQVRYKPVIQQFLERQYNTTSALEAYKTLGVVPAWL